MERERKRTGVGCPKGICHGKVKHGIQRDIGIHCFSNVVNKVYKTMHVLVCVCVCICKDLVYN